MKTTILFECADAASEAAYMLRGEWDGFNSVIVQDLDETALEFVANQLQVDYCTQGDICFLLGTITELFKQKQNTSNLKTEELLSRYSNNVRDFQDTDLRFINLSGANLTGINLKNADLYQANLKGTNLTNANLQGAILANADLEGANLTGANLRSANLNGANLLQTEITKANLTNTSFENVILDNLNKLFIKLFMQNLFYELQKFKNYKHFGYLYGWCSILIFGTAFILGVTHLPLLTIVFSVIKGITIGITTALSIIGLFIVCQYLGNSKNNLMYIPLESLLYILVLNLIISVIGELNHALKETSYMFIHLIAGSVTVVAAVLSTLRWIRRMILS